MNHNTDTTQNDQNNKASDLSPYKKSIKSPGKALLFSGILPGLGQFYMKKWMRGLFFLALDGISISTWHINNNLAEDKRQEYVQYSSQHWDFSRWIHDYYKWYEYDENNPDSEWNNIRKVFSNYTDTLLQCDEDISQTRCYTDIWEHSHNVEFTWDNEIINSSYISTIQDDLDFKDVYTYLCAENKNQQYIPSGRVCENSLDIVKERLAEKSNGIIVSHHFFEGIQKYDIFFAGWEDNNSVEVVIKSHGDINATSPHQQAYRSLWNDYNKIKTLAGNGGKFMLINRVVSMVDAVLLAKYWNTKHDVKLSLNTYPDFRNNTGLGEVKLSAYFK